MPILKVNGSSCGHAIADAIVPPGSKQVSNPSSHPPILPLHSLAWLQAESPGPAMQGLFSLLSHFVLLFVWTQKASAMHGRFFSLEFTHPPPLTGTPAPTPHREGCALVSSLPPPSLPLCLSLSSMVGILVSLVFAQREIVSALLHNPRFRAKNPSYCFVGQCRVKLPLQFTLSHSCKTAVCLFDSFGCLFVAGGLFVESRAQESSVTSKPPFFGQFLGIEGRGQRYGRRRDGMDKHSFPLAAYMHTQEGQGIICLLFFQRHRNAGPLFLRTPFLRRTS